MVGRIVVGCVPILVKLNNQPIVRNIHFHHKEEDGIAQIDPVFVGYSPDFMMAEPACSSDSELSDASEGAKDELFDPKDPRILFVSSKKEPSKFVLPKGGQRADLKESKEEGALREAWEEGGIRGQITRPAYQDESQHRFFYEMIVEKMFDEWPEAKLRRRKWVPSSLTPRFISLKHWPVHSSATALRSSWRRTEPCC
jgi:8-oxo-dGTP pyrophosphatase MutT (NUDIX family)